MNRIVEWVAVTICLILLAACAPKEPPIIRLIQLMQSGEYEKAIALGEKLVAENRDNSQAHRFLLHSAISKGSGEEYRAKYQELIKNNPDVAGYHFGLGYIDANMGDNDAAMPELEKALELNPQIEYAHYLLGSIYLNPAYSGANPEKGLEEWKKEVELNSQSLGALQVYTARADYYLRIGNADDAEKDYERIAMYAFAPGDRESARQLITQIRTLRDELARLEAEVRDNPDDATIHYQLGILQYKNAKLKEATETWQQAAEIDPNDANIRNYLGKALLEQGRREEAIQHLQKAVELDSKIPAVYYNLAVAEESLGKTTLAVEHYKKYIELNPAASTVDEIKKRIAVLEAATAGEEGS